MKIRISTYLAIMGVAVALGGCIEEIPLDTTDQETLLVIEGQITTDAKPHTISVSLNAQFVQGQESTPSPIVGATVTLFENGRELILQDLQNGKYATPDTFRGQVGHSYFIQVVTPEGTTYQSEPETIVAVPKATGGFTRYNAEQNEVDAFIQTPIGTDSGENYLKWRAEGEFKFTEASSPNIKVCYTKENIDFNNLSIQSSEEVAVDFLEEQFVVSKSINFKFFEKYCIHVFQESISKKAYEFWKAVQDELVRTGGIFETPPARIAGNIFNVDRPSERVQGYFYVSAVDTFRIFVDRADSGNPVNLCRPFPPPPDECFNCLLLSEKSTTVRPDYWEP